MCIRDRAHAHFHAAAELLIKAWVFAANLAQSIIAKLSVSYTHLDVYKRQVSYRARFANAFLHAPTLDIFSPSGV